MNYIVKFNKAILYYNTFFHEELDSREEIKLANISLLVMKRRLGQNNSSSSWDTDGMVVELPDQENVRKRFS